MGTIYVDDTEETAPRLMAMRIDLLRAVRVRSPQARLRLLIASMLLCAGSWLAALPCNAAGLDVEVRDDRGAPVADAVVSLHGTGVGAGVQPGATRAVMDQKNRQFVPQVLAVRVGTAVYFPNSDDIRHHVYSFSEPKHFEIKLYTGTPSEPVTFDKPGVVVLGCNIHDWMMGYIYVSDTPYFVKTGAAGVGEFDSVPPGRYRVHVWHPRLNGGRDERSRNVELTGNRRLRARFALKLTNPAASQQPPTLLQQKFRRFRREDS